MIDRNGNLLNQITYNSKGEIVNQTSPTVSFRFAYTGREFDTSTGLYYNRARYYDPITGRFISQDPIGFDSGDVNLYRYVNNSPTNFTDRSGLFFDGLLASLITTVVITVLRGVITGNWEFSFGATFTDDGDVSLNFGSGPFNTGPIPLRTTSDFSNITLRSAADLGSTLNVNPIEFDTTFVPTTFDTRNLDFSNLRFTPQTNFFNSTQRFAWDTASLAQPNISRNLIAQIASDSAIPLYDEEQQQDFSWLTNAYQQYQSNQNNQNFTVGALGAVTLGTGASLGATNRVSTILSNAAKLGANLASAKATILAGLTGAIYFALPQKRVGDLTLAGRMRMLSIEDAQKYFLSNSDVERQNILDSLSQEEIHRFGLDNRISLTPNTGIQHTGHPSLSPEEARDLTQLGGFDLSDFRIPFHTGHDVYNDPKQFDPNTTFPFPTFDPNLSPFHTGHPLDLDFQPTYVFNTVILPTPVLSSGNVPGVRTQLKSLSLKPNDINRIIQTLTVSGGGQNIGNYIQSGIFNTVPGYKEELVLQAKSKEHITSIFQALEKGANLQGSGKTIFFEEKSSTPKYDIDVGVTVGGTITEAYQVKSLESNKKIIKNIRIAADQLINVPGGTTKRVVEIRVFGGTSGTYSHFVQKGREAALINDVLPDYSGVEVQIEFSGGTVKTYKHTPPSP